ncbi:hypothetical protein B0O99DRAFT_602587 [Bisporella sp. PMI_857]|nr:hypothetical protein B0O99DRAFT_602587 [Bisporella sp. PMI_857]
MRAPWHIAMSRIYSKQSDTHIGCIDGELRPASSGLYESIFGSISAWPVPTEASAIIQEAQEPGSKTATEISYNIAGHDSSGIIIGNALFHLSRSPKIWQKLRTEIGSHGDAPFTFELLKNLKFLQYVIKGSA